MASYNYNPADPRFKTDLSGISDAGNAMGGAISGVGEERRKEASEGRASELQAGKLRGQGLDNDYKDTRNQSSEIKLGLEESKAEQTKFLNTPATEEDYEAAMNAINSSQALFTSFAMDDKTSTPEDIKVIREKIDQSINTLKTGSFTKAQVNIGTDKILLGIENYMKGDEDGPTDLENKVKESVIAKNYAAAKRPQGSTDKTLQDATTRVTVTSKGLAAEEKQEKASKILNEFKEEHSLLDSYIANPDAYPVGTTGALWWKKDKKPLFNDAEIVEYQKNIKVLEKAVEEGREVKKDVMAAVENFQRVFANKYPGSTKSKVDALERLSEDDMNRLWEK